MQCRYNPTLHFADLKQTNCSRYLRRYVNNLQTSFYCFSPNVVKNLLALYLLFCFITVNLPVSTFQLGNKYRLEKYAPSWQFFLSELTLSRTIKSLWCRNAWHKLQHIFRKHKTVFVYKQSWSKARQEKKNWLVACNEGEWNEQVRDNRPWHCSTH